MMQRALHYSKCAGRKAYSAAPFVGIFIGGFLAGGLTVANPPPFLSVTPQQKVAVKPVQTAVIDPYARRTQELCATAADSVAKMRDELKELRTKAAAKIAPAK